MSETNVILVIGKKPATQENIDKLVAAVTKATGVIKKQKATIDKLKNPKSKKESKPKLKWEQHAENEKLLVCTKKGLIRIKRNGIILSAKVDEETLKKYL